MLPTTTLLSRANTLGWIGLGAMGGPMATNLYTKAWALAGTRKGTDMPEMVICEPNDANAAAFVDGVKELSGAEAAGRVRRVTKPSEVAAEAARVFTMLPSTPQVESVYLGEAGLLKGLADAPSSGSLTEQLKANPWLIGASDAAPGPTSAHTLLVDHTTLDPTAAKRIADDVHAQTNNLVSMIDGPVSGGVAGAKAGTLTIMFGSASPVASDLARGLLQFMSRPGGVVPCGGSGAGVGVKVCNNLVLAINQIGLAEGLALGHALKIDPLLLHDIFNTSSAQSWSSKVNSPLPEVAGSPGARDYKGGFLSKLMLKDVGLALSAAHAHSLPTPLTWAAGSVYEAVGKEGDMANEDFSVVYKWLLEKQGQGVEVGWKNGGPGDKQ
ncbi:hypothetical protein CspeluHIS016_0902210 [Cutaneotrichosporon spelunceum]|uniref:3-hydroxyisobutyrate dehydrogenase n=1 Tax=Cutaneotrichosporon spelunceum TaxID=1672016 RepID=A0AAD3U0E7_9TREE|nr:hypothetical protein CspeluHIS016_0902210 [Cutaneotrichosporon spelunceum]